MTCPRLSAVLGSFICGLFWVHQLCIMQPTSVRSVRTNKEHCKRNMRKYLAPKHCQVQ